MSEICSKIYICVQVKYPLFLSDFSDIWIFSTDFRKILITNLMKFRPARAELFHVDGRTNTQADRRPGMTKLIVAFRNFMNAPINPCTSQVSNCDSQSWSRGSKAVYEEVNFFVLQVWFLVSDRQIHVSIPQSAITNDAIFVFMQNI